MTTEGTDSTPRLLSQDRLRWTEERRRDQPFALRIFFAFFAAVLCELSGHIVVFLKPREKSTTTEVIESHGGKWQQRVFHDLPLWRSSVQLCELCGGFSAARASSLVYLRDLSGEKFPKGLIHAS